MFLERTLDAQPKHPYSVNRQNTKDKGTPSDLKTPDLEFTSSLGNVASMQPFSLSDIIEITPKILTDLIKNVTGTQEKERVHTTKETAFFPSIDS